MEIQGFYKKETCIYKRKASYYWSLQSKTSCPDWVKTCQGVWSSEYFAQWSLNSLNWCYGIVSSTALKWMQISAYKAGKSINSREPLNNSLRTFWCLTQFYSNKHRSDARGAAVFGGTFIYLLGMKPQKLWIPLICSRLLLTTAWGLVSQPTDGMTTTSTSTETEGGARHAWLYVHWAPRRGGWRFLLVF